MELGVGGLGARVSYSSVNTSKPMFHLPSMIVTLLMRTVIMIMLVIVVSMFLEIKLVTMCQ